MNKKDYFRIILGLGLNIIATVLLAIYVEEWRTSIWTNIINGAIAVVFIFPPVFNWAKTTRNKHNGLSLFIQIFLIMWCSIWCVFSILAIIGVIK